MSSDNILLSEESLNHPMAKEFKADCLNASFTELGLSKPVAYVLMSDDQLLELNQELLQHDYYTDIITLDYSEDEDYEYNEIYISIDRVLENASTLNQTIETEFLRVCLHGLLHLAGFNDKTNEDKEKMREQETAHISLCRST